MLVMTLCVVLRSYSHHLLFMALSLMVFFQVQLYPFPKAIMQICLDSTNFRGIALCSLFGKIVDNIILDWYADTLLSSELQFGFKANHSTNVLWS